ncbi:hypothetical protein DFQ28_007978 [Apophysomyces sp. BC1034]|nr:hypothetical protein DFQ28_007978 [Apophysomyces sp. BC1034]
MDAIMKTDKAAFERLFREYTIMVLVSTLCDLEQSQFKEHSAIPTTTHTYNIRQADIVNPQGLATFNNFDGIHSPQDDSAKNEQWSDVEESNNLAAADDDDDDNIPSDLTLDHHPGRKNEYYLDHYNDDGEDYLITGNNNDEGGPLPR